MEKFIIQYLCCPECREDLNLQEEEVVNKKIKKGKLICRNCKKEYPIIDYIPRFVESELYVSSFGDEWNIYKNVKNSKPHLSKKEMKNYLGLEKEDIENKFVLEIGCGAGPYLETSAKFYNAKHIIGIDLSRSVEAAYKNVGELENVTIIQANLFHLPFKIKFDLIYSLGVLHHTPNTEEAFYAIEKFTKQGGTLSVWLYGNYWERKLKNQQWIRKNITSKLSSKTLKKLSKFASYLYYLYKIPIIGDGLRERIPIGMDKERDLRELNTFDMYSPTYVNYHYLDEVYEWFEKCNYSNIKPTRYLLGMKGIKK